MNTGKQKTNSKPASEKSGNHEDRWLLPAEEIRRLRNENPDDVVYAVKITDDPFEGTVQWVADQVEKVLGYRPVEFLQDAKLWFRLVHPDDVSTVVEATWDLYGNRRPITREYRLQHKQTSAYRWIRDRAYPYEDAEGRMVGIVGVACDVTDRLRAEERVRRITEGTAQAKGPEFFRSLARSLAGALEMRYAFVAKLEDPGGKRARTLAFWEGEAFGENFEYSTAHTPCETVVGGSVTFFPNRVRELFPRDQWLKDVGAESYLGIPFFDSSGIPIGHMGVIDVKPMAEDAPMSLILRTFAKQAAAAMQR